MRSISDRSTDTSQDALVAAARKVLTKNADKLSRTKLARFELDVLVDRRARPAETQPARATTELIWLLTQNPNIISRPYGMANELPRSVFTSDHKGCCASKGKESPAPPSSVSSTICGDKEK